MVIFLAIDSVALEVGSEFGHEVFTRSMNRQLNEGLELTTFDANVVDLTVDPLTETAPNSPKEGRVERVWVIRKQTHELLDPGEVTVPERCAQARPSGLKSVIFGENLDQTI